jgi:hypothetical protein
MMRMIATTINNSISEKPFCLRIRLHPTFPDVPGISGSTHT